MNTRASILRFSMAGSLALATPALAEEWYVDAVNGSDSNGGTNGQDAWQTITHAVSSIPAAGEQTLYVLPGNYDVALGELFPIKPPDGLSMIGMGLDTRPVIVGSGTSTSLIRLSERSASIRGIDLLGGTEAVVLTAYGEFGNAGLWLSDSEVSNVADRAIVLSVNESSYALAELTNVHFHDNQSAIYATGAYGAFAGAVATNCVFTAHTATVFEASTAGLTLDHCLIVDNHSHVVYTHGAARLDVRDCLIAGNDGHALDVRNTTDTTVLRSTIAENNGLGIGTAGGGQCFCPSELDESIFFGNFDDLGTGNFTVSACDIGDGDFAGSNGNISADPGFVEPLAGDYRLRFWSPCIDAVLGHASEGVPDLNGILRLVDGNLDTLEKVDMGAYEFAPLFPRTKAKVGEKFVIELWGPDFLSTELWVARGPLVPPTDTPFGQYELAHGLRLGSRPVGSGPPLVVQITFPPPFAGRTFSMQALTDSPFGGPGAAWTNAIQFTVLP